MLKNIIRKDAEMFRQLLTTEGQMPITRLEELTGYRTAYLYLVLGWLSRDNAISYTETDDSFIITLNKSIEESEIPQQSVPESSK